MVQGAFAELIVGIRADPQFGMVLVIGAGGVLVEILHDSARLLLPTDRKSIEAAIRSLKVFALLDGYRRKPKANIGLLVDAIVGVVNYATENRHTVAEIDINPLMALSDGGAAVAVDALIIESAGIDCVGCGGYIL